MELILLYRIHLLENRTGREIKGKLSISYLEKWFSLLLSESLNNKKEVCVFHRSSLDSSFNALRDTCRPLQK